MNKPNARPTRWFRARWPWLALLALLFVSAWIEPLQIQGSFPRVVHIGERDLGVAQGWSAKEQSDTLPGPNGVFSEFYRWSGASSSLVFAPAVQYGAHIATLKLLSGRRSDVVVPVRAYANDHALATFSIGAVARNYHLFVPGDLADAPSLDLRLDVPAFRPQHDANRLLGVIGVDARVEQVGGAPWLPRPVLPLLGLGVAAVLLANGVPQRRAALLAALAVACAIGAGFYAPEMALAAARLLAELLFIAAACVAAARWWRRHGRPIAHPWVWAAALLVLVSVLALTPTMSADGVEYYAYLRSLAVDHDIDFTNEYVGPEVPFERVPTWMARVRSPTGYAQNLASVGPAIVAAPLYPIADEIARVGRAFGEKWTLDGYSLPYITLFNLASTISLPLTAWLCYLIARRFAGRGAAFLVAISLVAGSAIVDYGMFEAHYPHAMAATTVAAFLYWWLRTRPERSARDWAILGVLAGAMALMYWINAILMLLPALDLLPPFWRALKARGWRAIGVMVVHGLIFLAAMLVTFSPQMIAWRILYGKLFTIPHGASFAEPGGFKALESLFSPEHGQLLWAPITVVGMLGMGWYIARRRWEGVLVLLAFAIYFVYNSTLGSWAGGGSFGLRRIANILPLLAPGLACLFAWLARRVPTAPLTICALCLAWNGALLLRFLAYLIPHHPSELEALSVGEFVLAPNNLPWSVAPQVFGNAVFPRLLIEGAGNFGKGAWVGFALLLGATVAILLLTVALIAWLHRRLTGEPRRRAIQVGAVSPSA